MEDNIIEFEENGKTVKYDVILNLEDINGKNFIVYTKRNKKDKKDVICYASEYKIEKGKTKLYQIKNDEDYELVNEVLNSLQNGEKNGN